MKAFSDQRPPSDAALLICTSKTNTFSFVIRPHLLLEKSRRETRHFTDYIPFLCLADPHNCKHMKGVTGKKRDHLCSFTKHLFHLNFTAYVCYNKSPLTVPGSNWRNFSLLRHKKKKKKVNRDKVARVAPTQLLYSSHEYLVAWRVCSAKKRFPITVYSVYLILYLNRFRFA